MYKEDLALNNQQWLIGQKKKKNQKQTKLNLIHRWDSNRYYYYSGSGRNWE